jgi:hypothetical protein
MPYDGPDARSHSVARGCPKVSSSISTLVWYNLDRLCSLPSTSDDAVARIHIRAISADIPHPLALRNSLEYNIGFIVDPILQIAHNILALSFGIDDETRTVIWDWTTSELLLVCRILCQLQHILMIHEWRRTLIFLLITHFNSLIPHTFYPPVQITRGRSGCTNSSDLAELKTAQQSILLPFAFLPYCLTATVRSSKSPCKLDQS